MKFRAGSLLLLVAFYFLAIFQTICLHAQDAPYFTAQRVLLISIDGLHSLDLANFIQSHPNSTLAQLSSTGVTYTQAFTSKPSNSFPGLMALVTGGSPSTTGVWYEGAYARSLSPPGSDCKTTGTEVSWDGSVDWNRKALDAGGGINPAKLPLDPARGCLPVYPHSFLRVNTIFEAAHFAGMRTAWIDKHPSYEMVNGPSGMGVDDLFTPEIASAARNVKAQEAYDDIKIDAVINQINGQDHTGKMTVGVPALFGMSLQEFRFAQTLPTGGYTDAKATPSAPLLHALEHADQSVGRIVTALKARGLLDSTLIIISAKHGQAPIDPSKQRVVDDAMIPNLVNKLQSGLVALAYSDGDLMSIWLTDQSQTGKVGAMLTQPANQSAAGIQQVLWGESLKLLAGDPMHDGRIPDLVVIPNLGVFYYPADDKSIAGHGGFSDDATHVALMITNPKLKPRSIRTPVQTAQVAPTILQLLGITPEALQAVTKEGTTVLPGLFAGQRSLLRQVRPE
ncbi:MAG: alkaline phosphatase family protein [Acidobacteriia bacterium]|nr:alkaline phosphatase family protein [Terriglobia bacterium]